MLVQITGHDVDELIVERAAAQLAGGGDAPVRVESPPAGPLPAAYRERVATCDACPHYNDDANSGQPLDPPCKLAPRMSICNWKKRLATGHKPHPDCPWPLES